MKHELKIHPQYYCRVADGSKTFELRNNDRGFQPGDEVILKEWDPEASNSTGIASKGYTDNPPLHFIIGYVLVLDSSQVIFSLLPPPKQPVKKAQKKKY